MTAVEQYFGKDIGTEVSELNQKLGELILHKKDKELAETFFSSLDGKGSLSPDANSFAIMISFYCKKNQLQMGKNLLNLMKNMDMKPNSMCYNPFMDAHLSKKSKRGVLEFYNLMLDDKVEPNPLTYKLLFLSYINIKPMELDKALEIVEKLEKQSESVDPSLYVNLIRIYHERNDRVQMLKWIPKLASTKIHGIGSDIKSILKEIYDKEKQEFSVKNFRNHKKALTEYVSRNELQKGIDMWNQMEEEGIPRDEVYGLMVQLYVKSKDLIAAINMYDEMLSKDLKPDRMTLTAIMSAFLKTNNSVRYKEAFEELKNLRD